MTAVRGFPSPGTLLVSGARNCLYAVGNDRGSSQTYFDKGTIFVFLGHVLPGLYVTFLTPQGLIGCNVGLDEWRGLMRAFAFQVLDP